MNRHCTEKDIQLANKHMKIFSTSLAVRKYKLKSQQDINIQLLECLKIKKIVIRPDAGEDAEKLDHS